MKRTKEQVRRHLMPAYVQRALDQAHEHADEAPATGDYLDRNVAVKYFNPTGSGTWLITDGERTEGDDWLLFGHMHIFEWEWGYVLLSDLVNVCLPWGLSIERSQYTPSTVREGIEGII